MRIKSARRSLLQAFPVLPAEKKLFTTTLDVPGSMYLKRVLFSAVLLAGNAATDQHASVSPSTRGLLQCTSLLRNRRTYATSCHANSFNFPLSEYGNVGITRNPICKVSQILSKYIPHGRKASSIRSQAKLHEQSCVNMH